MDKPMTRKFNYITVRQILDELLVEGLRLPRVQFYRLEARLPFPTKKKSSGGWRRYNRRQADLIKVLIKDDYALEDNIQKSSNE